MGHFDYITPFHGCDGFKFLLNRVILISTCRVLKGIHHKQRHRYTTVQIKATQIVQHHMCVGSDSQLYHCSQLTTL